MAPAWEMGFGMEFGMGMGMGNSFNPSMAASVPQTTYTITNNSSAYLYGLPSADTLRIDDLLDFSNHDTYHSSAAVANDVHHLPLPENSSVAGQSGSSTNYHHNYSSFPDDLYIPSEEVAELEWLSKFVEDSFTDVPYPSSVTDVLSGNVNNNVRVDSTIPGRGARSKRSRNPSATTAAATWSSSLTPPPQSSSSSSTSSSSSSDFPSPPNFESVHNNNNRKRGEVGLESGGGVRRCTHCLSEKTPQWRTGPLGPKTLCNACGVRYKSGRLVPEYRPAASPTFVLTQHSNSHRKVMELRRQKEVQVIRHDQNNGSSSAGGQSELIYHDYEVC